MKDYLSTIVVALAFLIVAIRLYRRYKKDSMSNTGKTESKSGTGFSSEEEEYEPYKYKKD